MTLPNTIASAQALGTPTPIKPAPFSVYTAVPESGAVIAAPAALPEFSWGSVGGAKQYQLQVSRDIAFTTNLEYKTPLTRYTPTNVGQFSDGLWYWRVRVSDPNPGSNFSQPIQFTRQWASPNNQPVLISPASGATLQFFGNQDFSWNPVVGAGKYRFQIATSTDGFSHPTYDTITLYTTHQPYNKFANGSYFWRVIPIDPANREGTPSEIRPFQMGYNQVPTLLEPANNSFPVFTPTFRWTAEKGAQFYRLQYSTDPTFNASVTTIDTNNTTYTPESTLPNDVNYYWRVQTHSGASVSDWSPIWSFLKHWYLQPTLLTPTNLYQLARFPVFSWSPVPGAATYKIEWNTENSFPPPNSSCIGITSNTSYTPSKWGAGCVSVSNVYYWRVTPFDGNGKQGKPSQVFSFHSYNDFDAPALLYPPYNYQPDSNFDLAQDVDVSYPIFQWNRVLTFPNGDVFSGAYRFQIDTSPQFNANPQTVDTENLMVTPDDSNSLGLNANTTYYWRVCPTASLASPSCLNKDPSTPWWSQTWKMKFDPGKQPTPTNGTSPELLRPQDMREFGDLTPVLQWLPYKDADSYQVQISSDPGFAITDTVASDIVPYPAYVPETSLAQRSLGKTDFGTFYWRVLARKSGGAIGVWSASSRFMIAAHSQWLPSRTIGDPSNQQLIATSPAGGGIAQNFDLTTLYAAQDADNWYFGFNAYTSTTNMKYVLYLDQDHLDGSGATSDAQGISISTSPAYQPEYAIYISQISSDFDPVNAIVYQYENNIWSVVNNLSNILGDLNYDSTNHYLEIQVPSTAIGGSQETGSYALALFSVDNSGVPKDSVPASPNFPTTPVLSRFSNVTERLTLSTPFDNTSNDPTSVATIPVVSWEYPAGVPWYGVTLKVYLDPQFTTEVGNYDLRSTAANYADNSYAWPRDLQGDNTYYWRLTPAYAPTIPGTLGAYSEGWRIERRGLVPANLQESVSFATPSFSWDLTEGAEMYNLELDTDPSFNFPDINITTPQNSYTPRTTLANGHYYWRVRVRRNGNIYNEWSPTKEFDLNLPVPSGLTPNDPQAQHVLAYPPTFCWNPLIVTPSGGSAAVLAAYKYRLQVSRGDPTFSSIYDSKDVESNCWTPTKGYDEGKYYWRVAMLDGQGRQGDFSPASVFTKQYPITNLVNPLSGPPLTKTPTFKWTVVPGAAAYRLEVSLSSTFYPIYDSVTTNAVEYTPIKIYESPKTYYWRVAIIDADGKLGPFTNETIIFDPNSYRLYLPLVQ